MDTHLNSSFGRTDAVLIELAKGVLSVIHQWLVCIGELQVESSFAASHSNEKARSDMRWVQKRPEARNDDWKAADLQLSCCV